MTAVNPPVELQAEYFERPGDYHPHLTLGTQKSGLDEKQLEEIERSAARELKGLGSFQASFLRIYEQEARGLPYIPLQDLPLAAKTP